VERGRGWFRAETAIIVSHSSVVAAGTARCGETRSPAGPAVPQWPSNRKQSPALRMIASNLSGPIQIAW
jgi:hypothetical protein